MTLLQMSFSGAVLILVIAAIRSMAIYKLPKKIFLVLWWIALLRLLLPFSVPSVFSVYSIVNQSTPVRHVIEETSVDHLIPSAPAAQFSLDAAPATHFSLDAAPVAQFSTDAASVTPEANAQVDIRSLVWCLGMGLFAAFFAGSYVRCYLRFRTSCIVSNEFTEQWLKEHKLRRPMVVRQSDRISTPLTYGIFRPVILMPQDTDWENRQRLEYVLVHEYVHICRYDAAAKLVCIAALCIHWFNPMVWVLYLLFNRDMELACDESVVRSAKDGTRSAYAYTLIDMAEERSRELSLINHFSKNALEERIAAIMKPRKLTVGIICASLILLTVIAAVFTTSAFSEKMVFVTGRLFIATDEDVSESLALKAQEPGNDALIGEIASTVSKLKTPDQELQANFGTVGSKVVFHENGVAVEMDGTWIQFEPEAAPSLAPEQALQQLSESVLYAERILEEGGKIFFTIPKESGIWDIWISGHVGTEVSDETLVHYLPIESKRRRWEGGKTYSFQVADEGYTDLVLTAEVGGKNISVDLMRLISHGVRTLYLEKMHTAAWITEFSEDALVMDTFEQVLEDDVERINELTEKEHIDFSGEFLDGYYYYNPTEEVEEYRITDETIFTFVDWDAMYTDFGHSSYIVTTNRQLFLKYKSKSVYFVELENGAVKSICEKLTD